MGQVMPQEPATQELDSKVQFDNHLRNVRLCFHKSRTYMRQHLASAHRNIGISLTLLTLSSNFPNANSHILFLDSRLRTCRLW